MRPIRGFKEFIEEGTVKQQAIDHARSRFLKEEAHQANTFLRQIIDTLGVTDDNANTLVKIAYDSIMALIRAKMLEKGLNAAGQGAHETEVSYLRELSVNDHDLQFADQLRYYRNGIMYYGTKTDAQYAKKVLAFLEKIRKKLQ